MSQRLAGKSIVIIGGTTGLGLSAAQACAREGGRVVVVGRSPESVASAQTALGSAGLALTGEASNPATAPAAIARCREAFGGFHALYHVAGGSGRKLGDGPLHEVTDDGIGATLDINLRGLILSNRAAVRAFLEMDQGGVILNMGSVLGESPSRQHFATHVYAAAKSAVNGFSRSVAAYYAGQDIRVNVIAPALVETPMAKRAAGDPAILEYISGKQPLDGGRIGRPQDLDGAVVYLLSDESRYVTGQVLAVDGGWGVSEGRVR
jgi:NAD(P)-dependent dehydrogenase (short-subunit alcohol dehydrogenase family)